MLIHEEIDLCSVSTAYAKIGDKQMKISGYNIIKCDRPALGETKGDNFQNNKNYRD
jgi:hypothetical protein